MNRWLRFMFYIIVAVNTLVFFSFQYFIFQFASNKNTDRKRFETFEVKIYNQNKTVSLIKVSERVNTSFIKRFDAVYRLEAIINILTLNNAVLLDKQILQNLKNQKLSENHLQRFDDIIVIHEAHEDKVISFGIQVDSINNLDKDLRIKLDSSKCNYVQAEGKFKAHLILSNLYIDCGSIVIQVAILYVRGDFLWIGSDEFKANSKKFGDVPRAISQFTVARIQDKNFNKINVPLNVKKFLFDYSHSTFLECNEELAWQNLKVNYTQNTLLNDLVSKGLNYISNSLESYYKNYWLAGGTLLGWQRDCGIIPFTKDADLAIKAIDFEPELVDHFKGNHIIPLYSTLGLLNDSFEMRLHDLKYTYDIFFSYNETKKNWSIPMQWTGYQGGLKKWRMIIPYFEELCSAELLNHKYQVPCDPIAYLDTNYGKFPKWSKPKSLFTEYVWPNISPNGKWTDEEFINGFRRYNLDGSLNRKATLDTINKTVTNIINFDFK